MVSFPSPSTASRHRFERRSRRLELAREIRESLVSLANIGLVVSEFAGIAAALELVGVSKYVSIPVAAAVIWALVVFGSYRYAERVFLILSLAFLACVVATVCVAVTAVMATAVLGLTVAGWFGIG
jgi:Mn2+/Fe2+ NRAMP family transporter